MIDLKKISFFLIHLFLFLIILVFFLNLFNLLIKTRTDYLGEKIKEEKTLDLQEFEKTFQKANQTLSQIKEFSRKKISVSSFLKEFSSFLPSTVYLNSLSFQGGELKIKGQALTREELYAFKKKLEENPRFQEIYFLPYSWIKPLQPDFSLTFKLKNDF